MLFLDRRHRNVSQGDDGGASWTVIDQRHLAEDAVLAQLLEVAVAAPDLHFAAHDDEELVAAVAFLKIVWPSAKSRVGTSGPTRRLKSTSLFDILAVPPRCGSMCPRGRTRR